MLAEVRQVALMTRKKRCWLDSSAGGHRGEVVARLHALLQHAQSKAALEATNPCDSVRCALGMRAQQDRPGQHLGHAALPPLCRRNPT